MRLKNATYLDENFKIAEGDLYIKQGIIMSENTDTEEETIDCEDFIIIPGLFNSHFHGYSLTAKGLAKELKIENWCNDSVQGKIQNKFFENLDQLSSEEWKVICMKAYAEMIKNGITFVSESEPGNWPDVVSEAINQIGMRGVVDSYQKIGEFTDMKIGNVEFAAHLLEEEDITDETLLNCESAKTQYPNLFMTHCMENEWRRDLVYSKYNKSSVELYDERMLLDDKTILFHGVHLNDTDIKLIAENGASVVHCPVSNFWTSAGIAPIASMLENGVNVCMGTDYASADIWENLRIAYYLLKVNTPVDRFRAEDIFKMATYNGARAYGQEKLGLIKNGKKADLVFIKKNPFTLEFMKDDFSTIIHNLLMETRESSIHHVMVDGKWVLYNQELKMIDEMELNRQYLEILNKLQK